MTHLQEISIDVVLLRMIQRYSAMDQATATNPEKVRKLATDTRKEIEAEL